MTTLQVFDKPMCCSTGVCGPQVDPVLPKFAADLAWLKDQGVTVERYNLSQNPQVFVSHADVKNALAEGVDHALPLVRVDGRIMTKGVYPTREQLASLCGVALQKSLAVVESEGSCCDPKSSR